MNLRRGRPNIGDLRDKIHARYIASTGGAFAVFGVLALLSGAGETKQVDRANSVPQVLGVSQSVNSIAPVRVFVVENREQATDAEQNQSRILTAAVSNGLPLPDMPIILIRGSALEQDLLGASGALAAAGRTVEVMSVAAGRIEPNDE